MKEPNRLSEPTRREGFQNGPTVLCDTNRVHPSVELRRCKIKVAQKNRKFVSGESKQSKKKKHIHIDMQQLS